MLIVFTLVPVGRHAVVNAPAPGPCAPAVLPTPQALPRRAAHYMATRGGGLRNPPCRCDNACGGS
eukprot:5337244-Alexandrium_andersonii.AAC.1